MVYLYRKVRGMELQELIAHTVEAQVEVDKRAFEIGVRAEQAMVNHHVDHIAHIEIEKGDVDSYVVLVDSNITNAESVNDNSALSIEMGRAGYIDQYGRTWGQMKALNILTGASHLPPAKGRIARKRRDRWVDQQGKRIRSKRRKGR